MITAQEAQAQAILSQARVSISGKHETRATRLNSYQNDGKEKVLRRRRTARDLLNRPHRLANIVEAKLCRHVWLPLELGH